MEFVLAFVSAFFATFLVGATSKLIASRFASTRSARIAGFCVALGFALACYSGGGPLNRETALTLVAALGAVVALVLLRHWLLRPSRAEDGGDSG